MNCLPLYYNWYKSYENADVLEPYCGEPGRLGIFLVLHRILDLIKRIKFGGSVCRIVGPLLGASLEAGHEFLWGPPRPSLHAHDPHEECFKYHIEDLLKMNSFVPEIFLVWNSLKTVHLLFVKWQFYRAQILKVGNRC